MTSVCEETSAADNVADRASVLIAEMIRIADGVSEKDQVPTAKLQIEVRQWVVECYLLKVLRKADSEKSGETFAVNIHTGADASHYSPS